MLRHDAGLTGSSSPGSREQPLEASEWPCFSSRSISSIHGGPQDGTIGETTSYGHDSKSKISQKI